MTEAEWFAKSDVIGRTWFEKLWIAWELATERRRRLFACACVRVGLTLPLDPTAREAVEAAEEFADGRCTRNHLRRIRQRLSALHNQQNWRPESSAESAVYLAARYVATENEYFRSIQGLFDRLWMVRRDLLPTDSTALLTEVFGYLFRP